MQVSAIEKKHAARADQEHADVARSPSSKCHLNIEQSIPEKPTLPLIHQKGKKMSLGIL